MKPTPRHLFMFIFLWLVLGIAGTGCSAASPKEIPATATPDLVSLGGDLYRRSCAPCYGENAAGLPNLGKNLIESELILEGSEAEIIAMIKAGRAVNDPQNTTGVEMPPFGGNRMLSDRDFSAILAFIRYCKTNDRSPRFRMDGMTNL